MSRPEAQDSSLKLRHYKYLIDRWSKLIHLEQQIKRQEHQISAHERLRESSNSLIDDKMDTSSEGEIPEEPEAKTIARLKQRACRYVEELAKYEEVPRYEDKEVVEAQTYSQNFLEWFQVIRPMMGPWTEPQALDDASLNTESDTVQEPSSQTLFPPELFEQALKLRETTLICKEVVKLRKITLEQNEFLKELRHWTEKCKASDREMEDVFCIPISNQITTQTRRMMDQCCEEIKLSNEQTYMQVGEHLEATMHIVNQVHSLISGES